MLCGAIRCKVAIRCIYFTNLKHNLLTWRKMKPISTPKKVKDIPFFNHKKNLKVKTYYEVHSLHLELHVLATKIWSLWDLQLEGCVWQSGVFINFTHNLHLNINWNQYPTKRLKDNLIFNDNRNLKVETLDETHPMRILSYINVLANEILKYFGLIIITSVLQHK